MAQVPMTLQATSATMRAGTAPSPSTFTVRQGRSKPLITARRERAARLVSGVRV
jgi:hypothetical protein